jgi:hypothetical protein
MALPGGTLRLRAGRAWLVALAGFCLAGVLLVSSPAAASHPAETLGVAHTDGDFAAGDPTPDGSALPASPRAAALICLAVLALPGILAARQWRRTVALATLGLFLWFSAEAAFHSAHHLTDAGERCPVFAATQHLPGTDPEPAVPVLERPAPGLAAPLAPAAAAVVVVLDGEQARAPPPRPA